MASINFWTRPQSKGLRRSWTQRLAITFTILAALGCFVVAIGLGAAQWVLSQRQLVALESPSDDLDVRQPRADVITPGATVNIDEPPVEEFDLVEPDAANFLLTGADSGTCGDQGDNPGIGERTDQGRSDTIMLWRVNPDTNDLAVLSFPRDLWVDRPGGFRSKINAAYQENNPKELVDTLYLNFGIPVDHYVQVDLCAFRTLVDAVDGVAIPFDTAIRDSKTGIAIYEPGCVNLDGDAALAYVRSRSLQIYDPETNSWRTDGTGDLGRISRQQDFVARLIRKVVDGGLYSPSKASGLIDTNREYLVTDAGLTINRMLEFANLLGDVETNKIASYQIESYSDSVGGASIQRMSIEGDNMQAILRVFRGQALLSDAPLQDFVVGDTSGTTAVAGSTPTTAPDDTAPDTIAATDDLVGGSTSLPSGMPQQDTIGLVPVDDNACH